MIIAVLKYSCKLEVWDEEAIMQRWLRIEHHKKEKIK
jgi:hypothetical protein